MPRNTSDIWDALIYPTFLGKDIRSAQASFLSDLLRPYLDYAHRAAATSDAHWGDGVQAEIDAARRFIPPGSPGSGLKRVALASAEKLRKEGVLADMVASAELFFQSRNVAPALIRRIAGDRHGQMDLVANAAHEISHFGATKAVLWLYDLGLGRELAPPNRQIRRFLREWGRSDASLDDDADDLHAFPIACRYMRDDVAANVSRDLGRAVSSWRCQHAAWLWQTCRALLAPHRKASRLTVQRLLDFLDTNGWPPETLDDRVGSIEEIESVAADLAAFA